MDKNSGYIVKTKTGKYGRTYHSKGMVNGKLPVYLAIKMKGNVVVDYEEKAILCDPQTLELIGHID